MIALSADTSPEAEEFQIQLLRQATVARRFQLVRSLTATTRQLAWAGIKKANPTASDEEVDLLFVSFHYGEDLAIRLREYLTWRKETGR